MLLCVSEWANLADWLNFLFSLNLTKWHTDLRFATWSASGFLTGGTPNCPNVSVCLLAGNSTFHPPRSAVVRGLFLLSFFPRMPHAHELRSTVSDDKIFFVQIHLHTCQLWSTVTLYHRHSIRSSLCLPMYGVLSALPKIRCTVHIGWLIRAATRSCPGIYRSGESQSRLMHSVPVFDAVGRTV